MEKNIIFLKKTEKTTKIQKKLKKVKSILVLFTFFNWKKYLNLKKNTKKNLINTKNLKTY